MTSSIQYPNRAAALRAKLLGQPIAPNSPVVIDGETFFVRNPVIADRQKMLDLAGVKPKVPTKGKKDEEIEIGDIPMDSMMAAACVLLAVDETGNPLFTPTDIDAIRQAPVGGWIEQLAAKCLRRLNGGALEGEG